jgi:prepilin peptidase CpaA
MPQPQFAPELIFAWVFVILLGSAMAVATWFDLRYMLIPKQVSVATFVAGLVVNAVRGFWLGSLGLPTWQLSPAGPWLGALDGLLFSLAGFALAFGIFFVMWILGTAGGGDVKQFAAVGAWVGPLWTIYLLAVTAVFVAVIAFGVICYRFFRRGVRGMVPQGGPRQGGRSSESRLKVAQGRRVGWALPATAAVLVVLLWVLRSELGLRGL